jgi:orotate phosphoribosyltransferase
LNKEFPHGRLACGPDWTALAQDFVRFAVESGVLRFGEFKTKAGRMSPYFFNAGLFDDGAKLGRLAQFYAKAPAGQRHRIRHDVRPRLQGHSAGCGTVAVELARLGRNVPFAYNRKEAKDHGEGGTLVGAPLKGRVLIVDDVMSAGTAARESIAIIRRPPAPRPMPWPLRWTARKKPPRMARMWTTVPCSTCATNWACRSAPLRDWLTCCNICRVARAMPWAPTMPRCWPTASATEWTTEKPDDEPPATPTTVPAPPSSARLRRN